MNKSILTFITFITFIIFSLNGSASLETKETLVVKIDIKPQLVNGKLYIEGVTNLPDQMDLLVSVSKGTNYSSDSTVKVMHGTFKSEEFSHYGEPLKNGVYDIEVSSPLARFQDISVQNIIGKHGEKLAGKLVEKGNDIVEGDYFINLKEKYTIKNSANVENDLPLLVEYLNKFQSHYANLLTDIDNHKIEKGNRSGEWFRKLESLKEEFRNKFGSNLNEYKGDCPQAFLHISLTANYMRFVLSSYNAFVGGRASQNKFNEMKMEVKDSTKKSKDSLDGCKALLLKKS